MNNTAPIIGQENQYEYSCDGCGVTAYGRKGRVVCDDCKTARDPRPYDLANPEERKRLYREIAGYLYVCRRCGGDFDGRRYALEAVRILAELESSSAASL